MPWRTLVNVDTKCRQLNSVIVIIGSFTVNQSGIGMDIWSAATLPNRFHSYSLLGELPFMRNSASTRILRILR